MRISDWSSDVCSSDLPAAKVSAHYVVDEDGTVYRLVAEERRAWHAGVSAWRGARDVNSRSIGIELVNPGHERGYRPFPEPQMAARSEERRVGKECVRKWKSWWSPAQSKKKNNKHHNNISETNT